MPGLLAICPRVLHVRAKHTWKYGIFTCWKICVRSSAGRVSSRDSFASEDVGLVLVFVVVMRAVELPLSLMLLRRMEGGRKNGLYGSTREGLIFGLYLMSRSSENFRFVPGEGSVCPLKSLDANGVLTSSVNCCHNCVVRRSAPLLGLMAGRSTTMCAMVEEGREVEATEAA